jgi:putative salt-induced outer membrane protein YdiY
MEREMKKIWVSLVILALAGSVTGAEKKAKADQSEPIAKNGFATTLSAGLTLTDGNSETLAANASLKTEGEKEGLGSVLAGVEANYGESTVDEVESTTVENAKVFANVKKTMSPRTFGYLDASVLYDDVALIDYRATVGPGLGAYLVKNDKRTLTLEAGPSYVWEKVDGASDDYLALRFAERYTCQISKTAKLVQSLEYMPAAEDFDDYLLTGEIGVEAAMTDRLSLKVVLQDKYDSTPAEGAEYNDVSVIAGIGITL